MPMHKQIVYYCKCFNSKKYVEENKKTLSKRKSPFGNIINPSNTGFCRY